jgi:hypothetical protein
MSKAYSKLTLIGTLACVVAAIVAGSASARVGMFSHTTPALQKPLAAPGYSDFPEVVRTMNDAKAQRKLAAPGYSDFPEVVRTMNEWNASKALAASVVTKSDGGFKWGDAGVGAGTVLALASILAAVIVAVKRRNGTPAHA